MSRFFFCFLRLDLLGFSDVRASGDPLEISLCFLLPHLRLSVLLVRSPRLVHMLIRAPTGCAVVAIGSCEVGAVSVLRATSSLYPQ